VGDKSHVFFGQTFPDEKESERLHCEFSSSKFRAKSLRIFSRCVTAICENDYLVCQEEFFVINPLDAKENYKKFLTLLPSVSHFLLSVSLDYSTKHPCRARAFFPESNHCQGI
jgi:hypothetical protein